MSLNLFETVPDIQPEIMPSPTERNVVLPRATAQLFIATDLSRVEYAGSEDDILLEQRVYRRLTPEYYVWLRSRMEMASNKHTRGLLPDANYQAIRQRFNDMHDDAVALLGEERLLKALATVVPDRYLPPMREYAVSVTLDKNGHAVSHDMETSMLAFILGQTVHELNGSWQAVVTRVHAADQYFPAGWVELRTTTGTTGQADVRYLLDANEHRLVEQMIYIDSECQAIKLARDESLADFAGLEASLPLISYSVPGNWRFKESPPFIDYLKVNEIRNRAAASGWTDIDLFQTEGQHEFPGGQDYGLVCYLRGRTVTEVTADWIELCSEKQGGTTLKFLRPNRTIKEQ